MYSYTWDPETGGYLMNSTPLSFSNEPRPVYYKELDLLGFDRYWNYAKDDTYPYMWAESNKYWYRGRKVAETKGGSLYNAPEIKILEEPEPENHPLKFVDIPEMVNRNHEFMQGLIQETIKTVYNTWQEYRNKVDVFYVAFSGGKDSIVTLDIVEKALPHNEFLVLFGDTQMEFPDTYDVIKETKVACEEQGITFLISKAEKTPEETWNLIGPPAQKLRWCCSILKTTPQILLLREYTKNPHFRGMGMVGVRADESLTRSKYDQINFGTKHKGQYDFYPILYWNTAELFLYIYENNLTINKTYKLGNTRAGCLVCPMATNKSLWIRNQLYEHCEDQTHCTDLFNNLIIQNTIARDMTESKQKEFMEVEAWKSRHNGEKLSNPLEKYSDETQSGYEIITITDPSTNWKQWIKTLGPNYWINESDICINFNGEEYIVNTESKSNSISFKIAAHEKKKNLILFISALKDILRKSAYCITCKVCQVNCPNGFIHMNNGNVEVDDRCVHCLKCHKVSSSSCWVAFSHLKPKGNGQMDNKSIDRYKTLGIQFAWVSSYFDKLDDFWNNNSLGTMQKAPLKTFLSDAGVSVKNKITPIGQKIVSLGAESETAWALMLCNAVYTAQFNWWIKNIKLYRIYTKDEILTLLAECVPSEKSRRNIVDAFKIICNSNTILGTDIGFGMTDCTNKGKALILNSVTRVPWNYPDPRVILYSLYKFADACEGYYDFRLSYLMDESEERAGISPSQIFGLDEQTMQQLLEGLSINYPQLIHAAFNLDLDSISLLEHRADGETSQAYMERILGLIFD